MNPQPVYDNSLVSDVLELFKPVKVLYSGAFPSAIHTISGIGYKLKECDVSGQYVGHTSKGTVIRCD